MKVTVAQMALIVLGLALPSFAAPAVDGVSKQLSSRNEKACIDMWQDPGRQTPIHLNFCNQQDACIPQSNIGAMRFQGTCCQLFAEEDCNAASGSSDYFLSCNSGVIPAEWRFKVKSIQCYFPGDWGFKRSTVDAAAAAPPLRLFRSTIGTKTFYHIQDKREVKTVYNTTSSIKTTYPTLSQHAHSKPTLTTYPTLSQHAHSIPTLPMNVERAVNTHITYVDVVETLTDATHTWTETAHVGHSVRPSEVPGFSGFITVTSTVTETISAAAIPKRTSTTTLPWNFPTSGWLSGSGSAITWSTSSTTITNWWSTSNFNITAGVSSVSPVPAITVPTITASATTTHHITDGVNSVVTHATSTPDATTV